MSDTEALTRALERFSDRADRVLAGNAGGSATVHINGGGIATVVACIAACFCVAVLVFGSVWQQSIDARQDADIRDQKREQQRTQDYLNMLWRNYPEMRETALKAKEDAKK